MSLGAVDDDLWSAVGDPTRRRMLDLLVEGTAATPTTLAEHLPVTRQAITKHLTVLDRVGLVHLQTRGRERIYHVDRATLALAVAQLTDVGAAWHRRLDRIASMAEQLERDRAQPS